MSLALDTNVLIPWLVHSAPGHAEARAFVESEITRDGGRIAIAPQVCWEFLHVVTDDRRFQRPCSMDDAAALVRAVWNARETERLPASAEADLGALGVANHCWRRKPTPTTANSARQTWGGG